MVEAGGSMGDTLMVNQYLLGERIVGFKVNSKKIETFFC